jgi:hypothetical protein
VNIFFLLVCGEAFHDSNCTRNCGAHPFCFFGFVAVAWRSTRAGDDSAERSSGKARVRDASRACEKKLFSKSQPSSFNCTLNASFVYYPYILPLSTSFPVIVHSLPNSLDPN